MGKGNGLGDGQGMGVGKGKGTGQGDGGGKGKGTGQGDGGGKGKGTGFVNRDNSLQRMTVPVMPMPLAIVCCVLNFLLPGFGTMLAGATNYCYGNKELESKDRRGSCLMSWGVGFLQLVCAFFTLVGWVWSCAWGILFLGMSEQFYGVKIEPQPDAPGAVIIHQSTVSGTSAVTNQPHGQPYGQTVMETKNV